MQEHVLLIHRFYSAFQLRDSAGMASCYHPEIIFSDPVFPELRGKRAACMWKMLCERSTDLKIEFGAVSADLRAGRAHWDARYSFSQTGNKVLNRIDARFEFIDGLIWRHTDHFDLYRWARQALGLEGVLLGWLPPVQGAIRKMAAKGLEDFIRQNSLEG